MTFDVRRRRRADGDAERMHISLGRAGATRSSPTRSCTSPTAPSGCASSATRPGDAEIDAVVEIGGAVASRQGLNIPGEITDLPSRARGGPRAPARRARRSASTSSRCASCAAPRRSPTLREHTRLPLIAKIEKPQAVERIEEIVRAADCVMVARGDLGIELRIEEVPLVQKQVIALRGRRWRAR